MASYRNFLIAKGLSKNGYDITVLSTANKDSFPQQEEDLNELDVHYLTTLDYRTFNKSEKASGTSDTGSTLKQFIRKLKESFPLNLFFGLGGIIYIILGIFKAHKIIREKKCELMISHFPPISNQIIASYVKMLNPNIKWIADFHHLYVDSDKINVVLPKLQERWIKNILKNADHLITVSEGLQKGLSLINKSNTVIELGFEKLDNSEQRSEPQSNTHFTISYCGSIYDEQTFDILLKTLKSLHKKNKLDLQDISFIYAGANYQKWYSRIESFIVPYEIKNINLGVISREESYEIISASNINLLLSWNSNSIDTIIPGKYYDYIRAKSPILLIINGKKDPGWNKRFDELHPGFLSYENDEIEELENFIFNEYNSWKNNMPSEVTYVDSVLNKHSIDSQMGKLIKLIQEIM